MENDRILFKKINPQVTHWRLKTNHKSNNFDKQNEIYFRLKKQNIFSNFKKYILVYSLALNTHIYAVYNLIT